MKSLTMLAAIFAFLFLFAGFVSAESIVELGVGAKVFDLVKTVEVDDESEDFDSSVMIPFGVFGGYKWSSFAIGAEFFYQKGDIEQDQFETEIRTIRFGPQFRYFILPTDKLLPWAGASVCYVRTTLEPKDVDQAGGNHLNVGIHGGALYKVHKNVALGGSGRIDYYHALSPIEFQDVAYEGVFFDYGELSEVTITWATFSVMFNVAFLF